MSNTAALDLAREVVRFHDEQGLPYDVSLEMARDAGKQVALLGILCEGARRRWSPRLLREVVLKWSRLFPPSAAEREAVNFLLAQGETD